MSARDERIESMASAIEPVSAKDQLRDAFSTIRDTGGENSVDQIVMWWQLAEAFRDAFYARLDRNGWDESVTPSQARTSAYSLRKLGEDQLARSYAELHDFDMETCERILESVQRPEDVGVAALSLLGNDVAQDRAAGAGLMYIATLLPNFYGKQAVDLMTNTLDAMKLPADLLRFWEQDGGNSDNDPEHGPDWAKKFHFRALCQIEQDSPGIGRELLHGPSRIAHFGRYERDDLTRQRDLWRELTQAVRTGTPISSQLQRGYSLIGVGDDDWNSSIHLNSRGGFGLMNAVSGLGATHLIVEFSNINHIADAVLVLMRAHGIDPASLYDQPVDLVRSIIIQTHGWANGVVPGDELRSSSPSSVTKESIHRYPPNIFHLMGKLGVHHIIVSGCEGGQEGGIVQELSGLLPSSTLYGSKGIDSLYSAWFSEGPDPEDRDTLYVEFKAHGLAKAYKAGQPIEKYKP